MVTDQQKKWTEDRMSGPTGGGFYRDGRIYHLVDGVEVDVGPMPEDLILQLANKIQLTPEEEQARWVAIKKKQDRIQAIMEEGRREKANR